MSRQIAQASDGPLPRYDEEAGQTMVEYGFVLIAVALAAFGAYRVFGNQVSTLVSNVTW